MIDNPLLSRQFCSLVDKCRICLGLERLPNMKKINLNNLKIRYLSQPYYDELEKESIYLLTIFLTDIHYAREEKVDAYN